MFERSELKVFEINILRHIFGLIKGAEKLIKVVERRKCENKISIRWC